MSNPQIIDTIQISDTLSYQVNRYFLSNSRFKITGSVCVLRTVAFVPRSSEQFFIVIVSDETEISDTEKELKIQSSKISNGYRNIIFDVPVSLIGKEVSISVFLGAKYENKEDPETKTLDTQSVLTTNEISLKSNATTTTSEKSLQKSQESESNFLSWLSFAQKEREKSLSEITELRTDVTSTSSNYAPEGLTNEKILALDNVGYTRMHGVIKMLIDFEAETGLSILKTFDIIAGCESSGFLAFAIVAGIPLKEIQKIWIDFGEVYYPSGIFDKLVVNFTQLLGLGFRGVDPERALNFFKSIFKTNTNDQLRLEDLNKYGNPDIYAIVNDIDNRSIAYTLGTHPNVEVSSAVLNVIYNPITFRIKAIEKGLSVLMGDSTWSPVQRLLYNNKNVNIFSVGSRPRAIPMPEKGQNNDKTNFALAYKQQSECDDYRHLIELMKDPINNIVRVEMPDVDTVQRISTREDARLLVIEAARGVMRGALETFSNNWVRGLIENTSSS